MRSGTRHRRPRSGSSASRRAGKVWKARGGRENSERTGKKRAGKGAVTSNTDRNPPCSIWGGYSGERGFSQIEYEISLSPTISQYPPTSTFFE